MFARILAVVLLGIASTLSAQSTAEFGNVTAADLATTHYASDPDAAAVILATKGSVKLDYNSTQGTIYRRFVRIKIFKQSALDEWSRLVELTSKDENLNIEAATYNLVNGKVVATPVSGEQIYRRKLSPAWTKVSMVFPDAKVGSVLEYTVTVKAGALFLRAWQFQFPIPVVYSEFSMKNSPTRNLQTYLVGSLAISDSAQRRGDAYLWRMRNIPAFRPEPLMPIPTKYYSAIYFYYHRSSWEELYWGYYASHDGMRRVKKSGLLKSTANTITAGITDPVKKMNAVCNWVKHNIAWNGVNDLLAYPFEEVIERKRGTAGDINLLLTALLNQADIQASPLLLATRDYPEISDKIPLGMPFNYVVCAATVNGEKVLLDATDPYLPNDMLPARCLNHKGFLIGDGAYGWIAFEPSKGNKTSAAAMLRLTNNGTLDGEVTITHDGYNALNIRHGHTNDKRAPDDDVSEDAEPALDLLAEQRPYLTQLSVADIDDIEKPVTEKYKVTIDGYATQVNDVMYLNPYIFLRELNNPFTSATRTYPIVLDNIVEKNHQTTLTLPDHYIAQDLPPSKTITLPDDAGTFSVSVTQNGTQLTIVTHLQINRTFFTADEYPSLRDFYSAIVACMAEQIVLVRKV